MVWKEKGEVTSALEGQRKLGMDQRGRERKKVRCGLEGERTGIACWEKEEEDMT